MLLKLVLIFLVTTASFTTSAQPNFDSLTAGQSFQCSEVAANTSALFSSYIRDNKIDSAEAILTYWKSRCGINEAVQRATYIIALAKGENLDDLTNDNTFGYLSKFKYRLLSITNLNYMAYYRNEAFYDFVPIGQEFDKASIAFFKDQVKTQPEGSINYLLSLAYATNPDTVYTELQKTVYHNSYLYYGYKRSIVQGQNWPRLNVAWLTGVWMPTGDLKRLGTHPEIGFQMGFKKKKMSYDLTMAFKFLKAKEDYEAKRVHSNNSSVLTRQFFGGYIGIDAARDMFRSSRTEYQLLGGVGWDGWDAIKEDKSSGLRSETVASYNLNFGLGFRHYVGNVTYIGVRAKYNVVNYKLNDIVGFTGNPISITFIVGGLTPAGYNGAGPFR